MKIETKYNVGDKVWYWFNNHIEMVGIIITILIDLDLKVRYKCDNSNNIFYEDELYPTQKELLKSL